MMYYIARINTWKAPNRKVAELQEFVGQFNYTLIADEISRDALVEEIRHKVDELNEAYPRTKKLVVDFSTRGNYVSCFPEGQHYDKHVFTICLQPVRRTYRFSEQAFLLTEGAEQ